MSDLQENSQNELLDSLLGEFLDESDQLLTQLNERLLQLDEWVRALDDEQQGPCDPALLNEMFRAAHSLKGLSAMLGLTDINNLTHKIENVFDAARKNELAVNGDVTELVFKGLDQLTALIEHLKQPQAEAVDCSGVIDAIRSLLQTAGVERKQSSQAEAERLMSAAASSPAPLPACRDRQAGEGNQIEVDPLDGVQDEAEIPQKYLSIFIDESETSLDELTGNLLALENGGNGDDLKGLMGTAHKIKGSAASIGLNRIAKLAHLMEDLLQELTQTHGSLSTALTDVFLKCTDGLQRHVAELKQGKAHSEHFGQLARELLAARPGNPAEETGGPVTNGGEAKCPPALAAAGVEDSSRKVESIGEGEHPDSAVNDARPASANKPKPVPEGEPRAADAGQRPTETVRVDIDRLDHLMDLAGQLVINKAQFAQIGEKFRGVLGCKHSEHALNKVFTELERMGSQIERRLDSEHSSAAREGLRGHVRRIQTELEPLRQELRAFRQARDVLRICSKRYINWGASATASSRA